MRRHLLLTERRTVWAEPRSGFWIARLRLLRPQHTEPKNGFTHYHTAHDSDNYRRCTTVRAHLVELINL